MSEYGALADRRICVIGDGLVTGVGDAKAQGWVGRVASRTPQIDRTTTVFSLGIPDEPTPGLAERWRAECNRRWHMETENRLVIGLGRADIFAGVSLARSRLNVADIVDEAQTAGIEVLVVGPPPVLDPAMAEPVRTLADAFSDVCARRDVPYIDCYAPLVNHDSWYTDLAGSDGFNPGQVGYGLMTWLVLNNGWEPWLGVSAGPPTA